MNSAADFARRIAKLDREVAALTRAGQISRSTISVEGEAIPVPEAISKGVQAGVEVEIVREAVDAHTEILDPSGPLPAPTAPTAGSIQSATSVHWDGMLGDGLLATEVPGFKALIAEISYGIPATWDAAGQPLSSAGDIALPGNLNGGVRVRFVAIAYNGTRSEPSEILELVAAVPQAPTGLTVLSNVATFRKDGTAVAAVTVAWAPVERSVDDAPVEILEYEVTAGSEVQRVTEPLAVVTVPTGGSADIIVRAVSTYYVWGEASAALPVVGAAPPLIPVIPSAPSLQAGMGGVAYRWDGKTSTGEDVPDGVGRIVVDTATSPTGPWTSQAAALNAAGGGSMSAPVGQTVSVRFRTVDTLGRVLGTSEVRSATALGVALGDLGGDLTSTLNTSSVEEYAVNDSQTTPPGPTADWSTDTPDWEAGEFVWRRTKNTRLDGTVHYSTPIVVTGADGTPGEDAVLLRVSSSRGTSFKNNAISTVLTVTVFKGSKQITNIVDLHAELGGSAFIEWWWRRIDDTDFGVISSADPRLSQAGFALTVSPADVDEQTVFQAILHT